MSKKRISYTIESAMQATGLGRTRFYQEIKLGNLRTFKAGRRRLVSAEALNDWVHSLEEKQQQEVANEAA